MIKRKYLKNQVIGNMRIFSFEEPGMTPKGLIPRYGCTCQNCGKHHVLTQDALRKRDNTGAIKCMSCSQVKVNGRSKKSDRITTLDRTTHNDVNFNGELHAQFLRIRL